MLKNCFYFSITVAIVTIFPIPKQKNKPFFDLVNKEEDKQIKQKRNSLLIFNTKRENIIAYSAVQ